jgi:hypothetical protein
MHDEASNKRNKKMNKIRGRKKFKVPHMSKKEGKKEENKKKEKEKIE